jgi:hypothetical protein
MLASLPPGYDHYREGQTKQTGSRMLHASGALLQAEAEDVQTSFAVVPMTAAPPPDMPGHNRRRASSVLCPKHEVRARWRNGSFVCPYGAHIVNHHWPSGGDSDESSNSD